MSPAPWMTRTLFGFGGGEGDGDEFVPGDVRDGPGVVPAGETGPVGVVDRGAGAPLGPPDPDRSNRTFAPTRTAATSTSASTTGPNRSRGGARCRPEGTPVGLSDTAGHSRCVHDDGLPSVDGDGAMSLTSSRHRNSRGVSPLSWMAAASSRPKYRKCHGSYE